MTLSIAYSEAESMFWQDQFEEAIIRFQDLKVHIPNHPGCDYYIGQCYFFLKEYTAARIFLESARELGPEIAEIRYLLGCTYYYLNHFSAAHTELKYAIQFRPDWLDAFQFATLAAIKAEEPISLNLPKDPSPELASQISQGLTLMGEFLIMVDRIEEAKLCLNYALALDKDNHSAWGQLYLLRQHSWEWENKQADLVTLLEKMRGNGIIFNKVIPEGDLIVTNIDATLKKQNLIQSASRLQSEYEALAGPFVPYTISKQKRIRIGYFSGYFNDSIGGYANLNMLQHFNPDKFELVLYDIGLDDNSEMAKKMHACAHHRLSLCFETPKTAIARIRADKPDILLDNQLYIGYRRPDISYLLSNILAARLAPIQIETSFCGTTGATFIDYALTDAYILPDHLRDQYTEHMLYFPDFFYPLFLVPKLAKGDFCRAQFGLPEDCIVYGALHSPLKVEPEVLDAWLTILKSVSKSVLWTYAPRPEHRTSIRHYAQTRDVDPDRIIFAERLPHREDHFRRYHLMDVFLDTRYPGAQSTLVEPVVYNVPIITFPYNAYLCRTPVSYLTRIGLSELLTTSWEDYCALAIVLGTNREANTAIRNKMEKCNLHDIFNAKRWVSHLEKGLEEIVSLHQNGEPFRDIWI